VIAELRKSSRRFEMDDEEFLAWAIENGADIDLTGNVYWPKEEEDAEQGS
jgi:hypothetical protein